MTCVKEDAAICEAEFGATVETLDVMCKALRFHLLCGIPLRGSLVWDFHLLCGNSSERGNPDGKAPPSPRPATAKTRTRNRRRNPPKPTQNKRRTANQTAHPTNGHDNERDTRATPDAQRKTHRNPQQQRPRRTHGPPPPGHAHTTTHPAPATVTGGLRRNEERLFYELEFAAFMMTITKSYLEFTKPPLL